MWYILIRKIKKTKLFYNINLIPTRIKLHKDRQYNGDDEFHHSLNMDITALMKMNEKDTAKYMNDLVRRRDFAHRKDIEAMDSGTKKRSN
jgi:hypothetical protein